MRQKFLKIGISLLLSVFLFTTIEQLNLLSYLMYIPFIGSLILCLLGSEKKNAIKGVGLICSCFSFLYSLFLWIYFDDNCSYFQYVEKITYSFPWSRPGDGCNYIILGIDGTSLFFIVLTSLLIFLCVLAGCVNISMYSKEYLFSFLLLETFLFGVFSVLDLLIFYVFFEATLLPMYIIINIWGSRKRKIRAGRMLFFYTLLGSIFMLGGILYMYTNIKSTNYEVVKSYFSFTVLEERLLWISFFLSFATKVPMLPFHIWLPEAHVEAPTGASVILAGILLKLGIYGFLRYSLPLFPESSLYFGPLVYSMSILGVIYTSMTAMRQTDLKRIIAYSSIAHMNLVVIGIYSLNFLSLQGSVIQSLSHGFVSSSLFLLVGVLYDRFHTRYIKYINGLVYCMPLYSILFLFFTLANIAFPGISSFVGEFLILAGTFKENTTVCCLAATSMVLSGAYSLWLFNRVCYGNFKKEEKNMCAQISDCTKREIYLFVPLLLSSLIVGIYPKIFLDSLDATIYSYTHAFDIYFKCMLTNLSYTAKVVELVDTLGLGSSSEKNRGSSPFFGNSYGSLTMEILFNNHKWYKI